MTYRKWGRTVRYENGTIVRVEEAGEAFEEEEFRAQPLRGERRALPQVVAPLPPPGDFERIVMTEGVSLHQYGDIAWSEHTRRMHLSVARAPYRLLIDQAGFDVDAALLALFAQIEGRREPPPRLTLAPRVAAAMLPSLIGRIEIAQRAGATPDGKGQPVESLPVTAGEPPNWYRPSYRVRPVRAWFNLLALPFGRLDAGVPRAVARLGGGDVLCVDAGGVFAASFTARRVLAAGGAEEWFPFGAGAWGCDMLLESGP
ncbi:MAG: hypothetical protein AABO58_16835 [Acidobacteriota bacterium]